MHDELTTKLREEARLTPEEIALLDEELAKQNLSASAVANLPQRRPSPIWRGSLDRRLSDESSHRATLRHGPAFLAAAAAIALGAFFGLRNTSPEAIGAGQLIQWHEEAVASSVLPGDGANLGGFSSPPKRTAPQEEDPLYDGSLMSL
jgi:hypothetical protein